MGLSKRRGAHCRSDADLCLAPTLEEFLTLPAYEVLTQEEN